MDLKTAGKKVMNMTNMIGKLQSTLFLLTDLLEGFADSAFYTNSFLKPEGTAQDFFNAISYPVDLQGNLLKLTFLGLYKIKRTCYFH
jgi:hypothetical protein